MNPYEIIGLPRDCTREQARRAFRSRVRDAHPDRGGDEAAFLRLCDAYRRILAERDGQAIPGGEVEVRTPGPAAAARRADRDASRQIYMASLRRVSQGRARRRTRWWDRNPRLAKAGLLGMIGICGVLVLYAALALGTRPSGHPEGRGPGPARRPPTIPRTGPAARGSWAPVAP